MSWKRLEHTMAVGAGHYPFLSLLTISIPSFDFTMRRNGSVSIPRLRSFHPYYRMAVVPGESSCGWRTSRNGEETAWGYSSRRPPEREPLGSPGGSSARREEARGGGRQASDWPRNRRSPRPLPAARHPHDRPQDTPVEPQAIELIQEKVARKHSSSPSRSTSATLHIAMADPLSLRGVRGCPVRLRFTIKPFMPPGPTSSWPSTALPLGSSSAHRQDIVDERQVEVVQDSQTPEGGTSRPAEEVRGGPRHPDGELIVGRGGRPGAPTSREPTKTASRSVTGSTAPSQDMDFRSGSGAVGVRIKIMAKDGHPRSGSRRTAGSASAWGAQPDLRSPRPGQLREKVVIRILDRQREHPAGTDRFSAGEMSKMMTSSPVRRGSSYHGAHRVGKRRPPSRDPEPDQICRGQHPRRSRTRSSTNCRNQPGGGARRSPQASPSCSLDAAAGPGHHHGGEMRDLDTTTIAVQAASRGTWCSPRSTQTPPWRRSPAARHRSALLLIAPRSSGSWRSAWSEDLRECRVKSDPTELDILRLGDLRQHPRLPRGRMSGVQRHGVQGAHRHLRDPDVHHQPIRT